MLYENSTYKISQNRFSNICEDILGVSIENKAKFGSTISIGKNIIFKNIELIKETKSKYVIMEFWGNDCDYNWREISENPEQLELLSKALNVSIDELLNNDVKSIIIDKVSNTEKLAGIIIKILKVIGILFVIYFIIGILAIFLFKVEKKVQQKQLLAIKLHNQNVLLIIKYIDIWLKLIMMII